jgi:hypothetical protein
MMNKRRLVLAAGLLALLLPAPLTHSEEPKKPADDDKLAGLMQRKLQHSQKVLEGVALNNFDLIAKHAEELIQISKSTDWKVIRQPQYELYSNEFRRTADNLVKAARDKNGDGAALTYVDLTLSCVKCHKYVREVRMTRRD